MLARPQVHLPMYTFRGYYISSNTAVSNGSPGVNSISQGWNSISKRISVSSSLNAGTTAGGAASSAGAMGMKPSFFKNPIVWYSHKLDTYPLLTNCITSALIAATGDLLCQYVSFRRREQLRQKEDQVQDVRPQNVHPNRSTIPTEVHSQTMNVFHSSLQEESKRKKDLSSNTLASTSHTESTTTSANTSTSTSISVYSPFHPTEPTLFQPDHVRMARFGQIGLGLAPVVYVWFGALHTYVPGTSTWAITKRVLYDQFVFSPIVEPLIVIILKAMEGRSSEDMIYFLKNKASALILANWALWFPAQFINFALVPLKWQVLFNNCVMVVWNAYISWTTFEDNDEEMEEKFVHPT